MLRLAAVRITGNVNPWLVIARPQAEATLRHCEMPSLRKAVIASEAKQSNRAAPRRLGLRSPQLRADARGYPDRHVATLKRLEFIQMLCVSTVDFAHSLHSPLATHSAQICFRVAKSFSRSCVMASGVVSAPVSEKIASANAARSDSSVLGSL